MFFDSRAPILSGINIQEVLKDRLSRSVHMFSSGPQMIGDEMAATIANESRIVHDETNFGILLQQALISLRERDPIDGCAILLSRY